MSYEEGDEVVGTVNIVYDEEQSVALCLDIDRYLKKTGLRSEVEEGTLQEMLEATFDALGFTSQLQAYGEEAYGDEGQVMQCFKYVGDDWNYLNQTETVSDTEDGIMQWLTSFGAHVEAFFCDSVGQAIAYKSEGNALISI